MKTQNLHHIMLLVADPDIWEKEMCKPLEEQRFVWKNRKYCNEICTWVYIDITTKEMCMGAPGIAFYKPYINHAISFADFYEICDEYKRTFTVSEATCKRIMEKYKCFDFMVTSQKVQDRIFAARAERERQLKLPKTIIAYDECRKRIWQEIPENDREYIFREYGDYIESEYNDWISRLKNDKITQKEFENYMFKDLVGRMLYWY